MDKLELAKQGSSNRNDLEYLGAEDLLRAMVERFHPRLYVACSFQKEESVIVDMLMQIQPDVYVFTLDTGVLFTETYETKQRLESHYGIEVHAYEGISLQEQARAYGDKLWERNPDQCCGLRKVTPLARALGEADCWITGLRREQSPTRKDSAKFGWDEKHGLFKANPLADWSHKHVWDYVVERGVPYNPLHDHGYESIGCTHCTQPGTGRSGRWSQTGKLECGLHE
jgi:phosphoadenosine phosphosulfate reductase